MVDHPVKKKAQEACIQQNNVSEKFPASLNLGASQSTAPVASRKRFSSICSEGSISGSIALDGLYCNTCITISDEDVEKDVGNKLAIIDTEKEKMVKDDPRKKARKRKMSEGSDSSVCEWEESRCKSLTSSELKSVKPTTLKRSYNMACESDSESDICVLPPPAPKQHQTYTLSSSSDSESDTFTDLQERLTTKMKKKSSTLPLEPSCNNKYKRAKMPEKPVINTRDFSSDSDSTLPDLTQGTDLILNIDSQLAQLIPKSKQDKCGISKPIRLPTNSSVPEYHHTMDYTKGQCDTTKTSSCDHWTQEMVNFYDLDISEDLKIEEVHKQQTNERSAWHIIAADYKVNHSKRYYAQQERCYQCRQFGHKKEHCPRVLHCHLCSETDHITRFKCPKNCCFRCGGELHFFCPETSSSVTCSLCGYQGHRPELCPDLWRRFHLTTSGTAIRTPDNYETRPPNDRFCFNCGRRGHFGHDCPVKFQNCSYLQVPQSVTSYSAPVTSKNLSAVIDTEGIQTMNDDVTMIVIKKKQVGRVLGRKGAIIQEIQIRSGATVRIVTYDKEAEVHMYGSKEDRSAAQDMIEVLLKRKTVLGLEDFVMHISRIKDLQKQQKKADMECLSLSLNEYSRTLSMKWYNKYLTRLGRNKLNIIKQLSRDIKRLNFTKGDFNLSVRQLIKFKSSLDRKCVTRIMVKRIRRSLGIVSLVVIGKANYGHGINIYEKIQQMLKDVEASSSIEIPEEMCSHIAHVLQPVFAPTLESLDELLHYAQHYQQSLQARPNNKRRNILQNEGVKKVKRGKKKRGKLHQGVPEGITGPNEEGIVHTKKKANKGKEMAKKKRRTERAPKNGWPGNQDEREGNVNRIIAQSTGEEGKEKTITEQNSPKQTLKGATKPARENKKTIKGAAKPVRENKKTPKKNMGGKAKKKSNVKQNEGEQTMMNNATKQNGRSKKVNKNRLKTPEQMTGNAPMIDQSKGNAAGGQKKKRKKCKCRNLGQELCKRCLKKKRYGRGNRKWCASKHNWNAMLEKNLKLLQSSSSM